MEMPETMAAIARDVWEWIAGLWSRYVAAHAILSWLILYVGSIMALLFWPGLDHAFLHWAYWIEPKGVQTNGTEGVRNLVWSLATLVGGAAAGIGLILAARRTKAANHQAEAALTQTKTAFESLVTERFTKAVEQLGDEKRAVRLGAIYALERIAKDSARDRDTIVETLAAYIRELASWTPPSHEEKTKREEEIDYELPDPDYEITRPHLAIDIAAALTVICRLLPTGDPIRQKVDLRRTDLRGLDAPGIDLSRMRFDLANLNGTNLRGANLSWADLSRAYLLKADLSGADLSRANLNMVDPKVAGMIWAYLTQEQITGIRYLRDNPPRNLLEGLTLPEPYDG